MSSPNPEARRLFLALWPSERERCAIVDLARKIPGAGHIRAAGLHLTLVFLGATNSDRLACYEAVLGGIRVPRMVLTLNRVGYWKGPRVLWLGIGDPPIELQELVGDLNAQLSVCGFSAERRTFRPHVTLRRRFRGEVPAMFPGRPIVWPVDSIALVESQADVSGAPYRVLRRWPAIPQG